jgi:hypothetical protein
MKRSSRRVVAVAALLGVSIAMFLQLRPAPDAARPAVHESATKLQGSSRHDTAKGPARAVDGAQSRAQPMTRRHVVSAKQADAHDTSHDVVGVSTESRAALYDGLDVWEQRFLSEANDAQWAAAVSQALLKTSNASRSAQPISQDLVDCKQTVCKLVLGFVDAEAMETHLDALLMNLKGKSEISIYIEPDDTHGDYSVVKAYLARNMTAH